MSNPYAPGEMLDTHRGSQRDEWGFQRVGNEIVCRRSLILPQVSRFDERTGVWFRGLSQEFSAALESQRGLTDLEFSAASR